MNESKKVSFARASATLAVWILDPEAMDAAWQRIEARRLADPEKFAGGETFEEVAGLDMEKDS